MRVDNWYIDNQPVPIRLSAQCSVNYVRHSVLYYKIGFVLDGFPQQSLNFICPFIYFWLCWVFNAARGLSLVAASGGYSSLQCAGFSLWWLHLLRSTGSRRAGSVVVACRVSSCGSQALEHELSSCDARAYLLRRMWDLSGPGLKPVSPALAGGLLTTAPPGNPPNCLLM